MRIIPRTEYAKRSGGQLMQWGAGCIGAMVTTLPSFAVLPFWFAFIYNYEVVDEHGNEDNFACGMICFTAGLLVWLTVICIGIVRHQNS
jgi:hypothetical protein